MIDARIFLKALKNDDAGIFTGVPCSLLRPFINHVITDPDLRYIGAVSEGEAVGIAVGSTLTGRVGVVLLQNSGLGNVVNPITSLSSIYGIPCLLIVSHRGDPHGKPDAVQHAVMGRITHELLDVMEIPWSEFPSTPDEIPASVESATIRMRTSRRPYAFILRRGQVSGYDPPFETVTATRRRREILTCEENADPILTRGTAVEAIASLLAPDDLVISATGMISRELCARFDREANFYMQGSMGTTAAIGLGVSLNLPGRRVIIVDGDGSALMRLGSLATVGYNAPADYLHVILDNGAYETTGGQHTASPGVSFPEVALACGYSMAASASHPGTVRNCWERMTRHPGPGLLHIRIGNDPSSRPGRPPWKPEEIRDRFMSAVHG